MRILGLDVGDKRIGVALSDPMGILASTLTVMERKSSDADFEAILDLVRKHEVGCIVVGLPRSMDGHIGKQAEKANAFAEALSGLTTVPVKMWDERLSTVIADKLLRDGGKNRGQIKAKRDAAAAALILQGYLDRYRKEEDQIT